MNILKLVDFNEIGYNMMVGVYSFLATVYNMLVELTYDTDFTRILDKDITTYTQPMYVLAGIFMLFRLSVSFLNYIIDPDKISDNQSGPSNILTRVIISIVLLMLLTPSGIVYDYLGRLQNAILTSGVLERITGNTLTTQNILYVNPMEKTIEQVDAASTKKCYYYSRMSENKIKGFYKLEVSSKKFSGATKIERKSFLGKKTSYVKFSGGSETYTSTEGNKTLNAKVGFQTLKNITTGSYIDASTCPQFIEIHDNSAKLCKKNDTRCGVVTLSTGWGGYSTVEKMLKDIANKNYNLQSTDGYKVEDNNSSGVQPVIDDMKNKIPEWREKQSTLGTENDDAINFTKAIGSSFLTCAEGTDEYDDCKKAVDENMFTVKGDEEIVELLNNDAKPLSFSFLPSLLVGIIVIVFIIVLCVDVVVRAFKLLMLQILAPIPIMNRIDPKDKMFDSWIKMYLSTYADLFIKLVAINFGITFLNLALELELSGLQKVFYVLGILVFIKAVPDMISNLFGIKLASGTFKDSMNMLKKGIGVGAGATLGFGVGAATGKGLGRATGAFSGALMGAGSGSKGKVMGGASAVAANNQKINTAKQQGLNFFDRTMATAAARIGMTSKGKQANEQISKLADVSSKNKALKDFLEGEAVKKNEQIVEDFTYIDGKGQEKKWSETYGKDRENLGVGVFQAEFDRLQSTDEATIKANALANHRVKLQEQAAKVAAIQSGDTAAMVRLGLDPNNINLDTEQTALDELNSLTIEQIQNKALTEHDVKVTGMKAALAKAKTVAAASYAKNHKEDAEVKSMINGLNDAIEEASLSGVDIEKAGISKVEAGSMDANTIKGIKEKSLTTQEEIGKENAKEIAKERYGQINK